MSQEVALLVASHGEFAKYALESAEMIVGKQENCGALTVSMDFTLDDAIQEMEGQIAQLDCSNGVVVLVDILGGTPSNVSGRLVLTQENVLVLSGLNLPMLLDLLTNRGRSLDEIAESLESSYQVGFNNVTKLFKEGAEEDECEIL
ncbi:PTS sugar transporter subunit IIA [Enterococcus sp. 669A]|uniref:PTS sugar transporter subunit IIA n=1 Tax=Candidatus Enterococcus moelleringii TaxID=2815325 RepID=A0ABS3L9B3_9ENTE|nr:PTS sugar transporter subunit IIA [Enterococcus sp. 669A]MBO1305685.1 PTS sugar transporter subunit IIA [Enterococcus sp. 669A]